MIWLKSKANLLGLTGLLIGLIWGGFQLYAAGENSAQLVCQEQQMQAVARAIEQTNQLHQQDAAIAEAYWQEQLTAQPKVQTIEKRIVKYVQTAQPGICDVDDDELQILTDLTHLVNGDDSTQNRTSMAGKVPAPAASN